MAFRLHPAHAPREPIAFLSIDALAAHLIRQRPGRTVEISAGQASLDGGPMTPVVNAWAIRPQDRRAFHNDPEGFQDDWLGMAFAGAEPWRAVTAALKRVRTAGGLAA